MCRTAMRGGLQRTVLWSLQELIADFLDVRQPIKAIIRPLALQQAIARCARTLGDFAS